MVGFDQILDFAHQYNLPLSKKRAIVREYLQVKILDSMYRQKISTQLIFVGGTALRLLRGLDRFSEDLDFDIDESISSSQIKKLMENVNQQLTKENILVDLYSNTTAKRSYFELRFKNLLYDLSISKNKEDKLAIKFDFEMFWKKHTKEIVALSRYGFLVNVVTASLDTILVQKLFAYLHRKQTLPRDIYDIVWLYAFGAKIDKDFLKENNLSFNLLAKAKEKYVREEKLLANLKRKLQPFLIDEEYIDKLDLFPQILEKLKEKE